MTKQELKKAIQNQMDGIIALNKRGQCQIKGVQEAREKVLNYISDNFNIKSLTFIRISSIAELYDTKTLTIKHYIDIYTSSSIVGSIEVIVYDLRKETEWKEV